MPIASGLRETPSLVGMRPRMARLSVFLRRQSCLKNDLEFLSELRNRLRENRSYSLGIYLSINSVLIRFSSRRGRMLSSCQPRSSVSSMERLVVLPWLT